MTDLGVPEEKRKRSKALLWVRRCTGTALEQATLQPVTKEQLQAEETVGRGGRTRATGSGEGRKQEEATRTEQGQNRKKLGEHPREMRQRLRAGLEPGF